MAPGKTAGTGRYPAPLVPVSCRYLLVNCCSFFSYKRGKFLPDLEKWPNLHACDGVGVVDGRGVRHLCFLQ